MKFKIKEIIIIFVIILVTLFLAFYSKIEALFIKEEEIIEDTDNTSSNDYSKYINVTLTGEIIEDEVKLKIPYGYTYGDIINILELYTNRYSIIDYDSKIRFTKDTILTIESTDTDNEYNEDMENKININTATKSDLITLYGIGEKRADHIIEYREKSPIQSFTELKKLLGVSDVVIEKIKEQAFL